MDFVPDHPEEMGLWPRGLGPCELAVSAAYDLDRTFSALADPTRRQILQDLKDGELAAGEIASRFSIAAASVSRHLSLLEAVELVSRRRDGNRITEILRCIFGWAR